MRMLLYFIMINLGLLLLACENPPRINGKTLLTGDEISVLSSDIAQNQFSDIPVPADFTIEESSYASQVGTFRKGRLSYYGTLSPAEAAEYLREQLPQYGWKLSSRAGDKFSAQSLTFTKGYTQAEYKILEESIKATPAMANRFPEHREYYTQILLFVDTRVNR